MKTLQEIDYKPLEAMRGAFSRAVREVFHVPPVVVYVLALAAVGMYYIGQVVIWVVVMVAVYFGKRATDQKNRAWRAFAEANGWRVVEGAMPTSMYVPPSLQGMGRAHKLGTIVHASFEDHECDLAIYQFTTGSGKSSTTHYYTIGRVELPRYFPHIILDSKSTWTLSQRGTAQQRVGLEGDFDKYFSLYCARDEHLDALSIITPDVMSTLIKSNRPQDIEIIGHNLYFMMAQDKRGPDALPPLMASIDALADEIAHKAKTIRYDSSISPAQQHLANAVTGYFKSGEQIHGSLTTVMLVFVLLPALLFIFFGFMFWVLG